MRWAPHLTVAAVVEHDGRFLLVEERIDGQLVLNQPAGHVENGESLADAVVREVLEETAWGFEPSALVGIYRWRLPDASETFFRFCFSGRLLRHHAERSLDTGILGTVWLTAADLAAHAQRHRSPLVGRCVADYLAGNRYPLTVLADLGAP
jgi:8-oxo-dGTP pyrophosphatase MutT (NUDIX family)